MKIYNFFAKLKILRAFVCVFFSCFLLGIAQEEQGKLKELQDLYRTVVKDDSDQIRFVNWDTIVHKDRAVETQLTLYITALPILKKLNKFDVMFQTWGKFENRPIDTNTLFGSYNAMRWNIVRVSSNVNSLFTMVTQDNKILKESLENSKIGKPSNFTDKNDETLWAAIGQTRTKVSNISTTIITSIDSFKEDANKKLESIDVRLKNLEPKAIKSDTVNFKILLGVSDKSVANLSAAYYVDNEYALTIGGYQVDINTLASIGIEKRINDMFFTAAPIYHAKHRLSMVFSCGFYTSGLTAAALYSPLIGLGAQVGLGF